MKTLSKTLISLTVTLALGLSMGGCAPTPEKSAPPLSITSSEREEIAQTYEKIYNNIYDVSLEKSNNLHAVVNDIDLTYIKMKNAGKKITNASVTAEDAKEIKRVTLDYIGEENSQYYNDEAPYDALLNLREIDLEVTINTATSNSVLAVVVPPKIVTTKENRTTVDSADIEWSKVENPEFIKIDKVDASFHWMFKNLSFIKVNNQWKLDFDDSKS